MFQQQMQAQQAALPHAGHAPPIPLGPHPALPGIPSLPPSSAASLLSGFTGSLVGPANHPLSLLSSKHLLHRDDNTLKEMDHPMKDKSFQSNCKE
ncbi:transducin-like enhancer protein 3 [Penaeus indicus]|uniref:transducin-like enhancer protein 3 n=1 Tax=Penaeus indicus TaxID=29960 RepID=UPI00300D7AF0